MKILGKTAQLLKIKNRRGFAAVCCGHLTEGKTTQEAVSRMVKALKRKKKRTI